MRYSFIKPRKKPLLNLFTRIWISFGSFSAGVIFLVYLFSLYEVHSLNNKLEDKRAKFSHMVGEISAAKDLIKEYTKEATKANAIINSNETLNVSIRNLFKLVPPSIVFSDLLIYKDELIIKGATPTKEAFTTLLETPLKSVFVSSKTDFYQLDNGWFNFINVNKSYRPKIPSNPTKSSK